MAVLSHFPVLVLAIAALLDYLIGDPWGWLHPVQVMGWAINRYVQFVLKRWQHPQLLRLAGVGLAIALPLLSGLSGWLLVWGTTRLHPLFGVATASIILASCFAGRSLRAAATDVLQPLTAGDWTAARSRLQRYVGRDTEHLSEAEIYRAILETVSENATDGVMAPLFWAIAGAATPWGSVPLALAYKAVSTLDSTVGYKEAPYTDLGWCSARLEDALTWVPCRLTVLTLALLSRQPKRVWQVCWRDAPQDPSPNAGWSECAYAVALGVQLGGTNTYRGVAKFKPLLGDPLQPITRDRITAAMQFTRYSFLLWLGLAMVGFSLR